MTADELDSRARELIIGARVRMLLMSPFWGNLATRLQLRRADDWCQTAATDGRCFYYNPEFVARLSSAELEFLFAHELLHCAYDHVGRRGDRDPNLSNIAADYAVNADLLEFHIGEPIKSVKPLYDKKYAGWSYERIYDDLVQNAKKIDIKALSARVLDEHLDGSGAGGQPELSAAELQRIKDEFREAMLTTAKLVGADNVPAGIKRLLKDLTEPRMNWRQLLRQLVDSQVRADFTFSRPSRRAWHVDGVLPSRKVEQALDVHVALDLSGSITERQVGEFLGELNGIMTQFASFNLGVFCFDTRVYNYQVFTEDSIDALTDYELVGGGGTSFECIWEFLQDEDIVPRLLCVFTDGYPLGSWCPPGMESYCETLFLINGSRNVAPLGTTIFYED